MAKIIWEGNATQEFLAYVDNAGQEFGKSTAQRWQKERKAIEWRLERFPESYPLEELLVGRDIRYRRSHIMNRRFKIIYHYNEAEDTVHVIDIWDTKRNPSALIHRIKTE